MNGDREKGMKVKTVEIIVEIIRIVLPVLLIGPLVIYAVMIARKKEKSDGKKEEDEDYMSYGMAIGMCLGTLFAIAFDFENIGFGAAIGMSLGMIFGMNCKKS